MASAALAGDPGQIDAFCRQQHPAVFRLCLGFLADTIEAEDAAQDATLRLLDTLAHWDQQRSFAIWRNTVVLNLCRDRRRQSLRRRRAEAHAAARGDTDHRRPGDELMQREMRTTLEAALRMLPDREREAVVLRDLEGNETRDVATAMGVTESTVRSLITLARRRLRRLLTSSLQPEAAPLDEAAKLDPVQTEANDDHA